MEETESRCTYRSGMRCRRSGFSAILTVLIIFALVRELPVGHGRAAALASHTSTGATLQAQVVTTDLALGRNRFAFGVLANNHPVLIGSPRLQFFYLHGNAPRAMGKTTATFSDFARGLPRTAANSAATEIRGVYVAYMRFAQAGNWGVEIRARYNGKVRVIDVGFVVREHSAAPAIGQPAPRSRNPTILQQPVAKLDSGRPPDHMHALSIAQAIAQHKPLVVLFSTPAFCESRMCGPQTNIVVQIEQRYRKRANFIHIEVYKDAEISHGYAPTFKQWHLPTEPWVFVINRKGNVAARFEGPTSGQEIRTALNVTLRARR